MRLREENQLRDGTEHALAPLSLGSTACTHLSGHDLRRAHQPWPRVHCLLLETDGVAHHEPSDRGRRRGASSPSACGSKRGEPILRIIRQLMPAGANMSCRLLVAANRASRHIDERSGSAGLSTAVKDAVGREGARSTACAHLVACLLVLRRAVEQMRLRSNVHANHQRRARSRCSRRPRRRPQALDSGSHVGVWAQQVA